MEIRSAVIGSVILVLASVACSKSDKSAGASLTSTSAAGGSPCAATLAGINGKAPTDDDKKGMAAACDAVSSKTQACIAAAKAEKDVDGCLADKNEKEAFYAAVLVAALKAGGAKDGKSGATKPAGATKLEKLGLEMDVPGEAMVSDGIGPKSMMVNAVAIGGLTVTEATSSTPKNLKAAKSDAKMFNPKNQKGEESSDGYWLTFENTGSMGTNYWAKSVRKINGKTYACEGMPDSADKQAAILAACKTLRP